MRSLSFRYYLITFVLFVWSSLGRAEPSIPSLVSRKHDTKPIKRIVFNDGSVGSFTANVCDGVVTFEITYHAEKECLQHKQWVWDKKHNRYTIGSQLEDTVKVFFFDKSLDTHFADIWVWRAGRTNPVGYADDLYWSSTSQNNGDGSLVTVNGVHPDSGRTCWLSRYQSKFVGNKVKRFYCHEPEGSCSDVKAVGEWDNSLWRISFSRVLDTGNGDDIVFKRDGRYIVIISVRDQKSGLFVTAPPIPFYINSLGLR